MTFRIIKGGEVEWLAQERTHGSYSVGCKSSPKGNTRSNTPHNLIFRNFLPQIRANCTIYAKHMLLVPWNGVMYAKSIFSSKKRYK